MELDWQAKGACVGTDADPWFDVIDHPDMLASRTIDGLRRICAGCPVQSECLSWALEHEQWGVWGGLTPQERAAFKSRGAREIA